ncbi:hypothetical protein Trydic_g13974 [Trypoxylus dichotomus]
MLDVAVESTSFPTASPKNILAIPKAQQNKRRTSREGGKTTTSSSLPSAQGLKEAKGKRDIQQAIKIERAKRKLSLGEEENVMK